MSFRRRAITPKITAFVLALASGLAVVGSAGIQTANAEEIANQAFVDMAAPKLAADWNVSIQEAVSRLNRQDAQNALLDALQKRDPDHYGGGYVDQANGGALVVSDTDSGQTTVSVAHELQYSGPLRVAKANDTFAHLSDLKNKAVQSLGGSTAVDAIVNPRDGGHVDVALLTRSTTKPAAALRQKVQGLVSAHPGFIHALADRQAPTDSTCAAMRCNSSLRGGQAWVTPRGGVCTTGFLVADNAHGWPYMMTAGHCFRYLNEVETAQDTNHTPHDIGRGCCDYRPQGLDFGLMDFETTYWHYQNPILVMTSALPAKPTSYNENYGITMPPGQASIGSYLCHTGASVGTSCGQVQNYGDNVTVNAVTCEGDSGGPWYANGHAYGIEDSQSGTAVTTVYSPYDGTHSTCNAQGTYAYIAVALLMSSTHLL